MRLWYLSHRRPAKAQASLRIRAVSAEPSLFADMKYGSKCSRRYHFGGFIMNEEEEEEEGHYNFIYNTLENLGRSGTNQIEADCFTIVK